MYISLPWVVRLYNNVSIGKKTCVETKLYMFNNPKSNREILVTKLKWKGFSFYKLEWELGPCHLSDFPFAWHSICPTFVRILNCICQNIELPDKNNSHVAYPISPTTMKLNIPIPLLKRFFFWHPTCKTLYLLTGLPSILTCFILFWFFVCI